jgi:cysteine-rich repeat protein
MAPMTRTCLVLCLALVASCVGSSAVECPDQSRCAPGTECVEVFDQGAAAGYQCAASEAPVCGDQIVTAPEACDRGLAGAACSIDCLSMLVCGDGTRDPEEACDDGNSTSHDACDATCRIELPRWDSYELATPGDRYGNALAFDDHRGVTVMFGGRAAPGLTHLADTWERDARGSWRNIASAVVPPARAHHAMAYDPVRHSVLMFGGDVGGVPRRDAWEWDGRDWSPVNLVGVGPRTRHAMAYDPSAGHVVVYGGSDGGPTMLTDAFSIDGVTITPIPSPPMPLQYPTMAFDHERNALVLVGVTDPDGSPQIITYVRTETGWTEPPSTVVPSTTSVGSSSLSLTTDRAHGTVMLTTIDAAYTLGADGWVARGALPTARREPATGETRDGALVMSGDASTPTPPLVWTGVSWRGEVNPTTIDFSVFPPTQTMRPVAVADVIHDRLLGFADAGVNPPSDMFELDGERLVRASITGANPFALAINSYSLAYDEARDVLVFVGRATNTEPAEAVTFTAERTQTQDGVVAWNFTRRDTPDAADGPPLVLTPLVYDAARRQVMLFGGEGVAGVPTGETWIWDDTGWTRFDAQVMPPSRRGHALAYDRAGGRVVMFGGTPLVGPSLGDTWEFGDEGWRLVAADGPIARSAARLAYDESRKRVVLYGGFLEETNVDDVWELSGTTWTRLTVPLLEGGVGQTFVSSPDGVGVLVVTPRQTSINFTLSTGLARLAWSATDRP